MGRKKKREKKKREKKKEKKKKNVYLYNEMIKPPGRVNCRLWNRNEALECLADEDEG